MTKSSTRDLILSLLKVQTTFRQAMQRNLRLHNIELTFEMLQVLAKLWHKDGINQQELGESIFKDKATLTSLLNNLEARDLVSRITDSTDRRSKNVYLTNLGQNLGKEVKPILEELYQKAELKLDKTKIIDCINSLQELNDVFKEL